MSTASNRTQPKLDASAALRDLDTCIARLHLDAVELTLPARAEQTARQWLSRAPLDLETDDDLRTAALAMTLALELESFTPSHSGATAVDRLARHRKIAPEEQAAHRALKEARFTPFVVQSELADDLFIAEDLATNGKFTLFDEGFPLEAVGLPIAARLTALGGETFGTVGMTLPLDAAGLAVAMEFVRPGRGIPHGHRCAAAVYRHVVRHGGPRILGLNDIPDDDDDDDEDDGIEHSPTALDLLAATLVEDGVPADPPPEVLNEVRRLVSADTIVEALYKAIWAQDGGIPKIRATYRRFAEVMIEALHLRILAGSGIDRSALDKLAGLIDAEVASSGYPREAADLFRELCRTVTAAKPREAGENLTRVIERIRGLRAKTVDQGCTEEEALAAADKVAELLDRYGLSLSEIGLREQACQGFGIASTRKRAGPLDEVVPAISHFCDCRSWSERAADGTIRSVYFGLPADVEAARYLYERVVAAIETETAAFQSGELYRNRAGGGRQKATTSFQYGLVRGIGAKLDTRKAERDTKTFKATGRDLVPVKESIVEDELAKLGMSFTSKASSRARFVLHDAYEAGHVASGRFEIQSELGTPENA